MADLNKVFLIGRLTFDPELRHTPGGTPVSDLRLATTRVYFTKDNERREEPLYIDVTVWGSQASNCCQYLKKGRQIHVEGYLKMESWEDRNTGDKRTKIKVEANNILFLDSGRRDDGGAGGGGSGGGGAGGGADRDDIEYDAPPTPRRAPAGSGGGANGADSRSYAPPPKRPAPADDDQGDEDIPF